MTRGVVVAVLCLLTAHLAADETTIFKTTLRITPETATPRRLQQTTLFVEINRRDPLPRYIWRAARLRLTIDKQTYIQRPNYKDANTFCWTPQDAGRFVARCELLLRCPSVAKLLARKAECLQKASQQLTALGIELLTDGSPFNDAFGLFLLRLGEMYRELARRVTGSTDGEEFVIIARDEVDLTVLPAVGEVTLTGGTYIAPLYTDKFAMPVEFNSPRYRLALQVSKDGERWIDLPTAQTSVNGKDYLVVLHEEMERAGVKLPERFRLRAVYNGVPLEETEVQVGYALGGFVDLKGEVLGLVTAAPLESWMTQAERWRAFKVRVQNLPGLPHKAVLVQRSGGMQRRDEVDLYVSEDGKWLESQPLYLVVGLEDVVHTEFGIGIPFLGEGRVELCLEGVRFPFAAPPGADGKPSRTMRLHSLYFNWTKKECRYDGFNLSIKGVHPLPTAGTGEWHWSFPPKPSRAMSVGYVAVKHPIPGAHIRVVIARFRGAVWFYTGMPVYVKLRRTPEAPVVGTGRVHAPWWQVGWNKAWSIIELDVVKMNQELPDSASISKGILTLYFYTKIGNIEIPIDTAAVNAYFVLDVPKRPWYPNETQDARSKKPLYQPWVEALDYLCTQAANGAQTLDEALTRVLQYVWKSKHLKYDAGGGGCWFSKPLALYDPNPYRVDLVNRIKFYRLQDIPNALYDFRKMLSVLESRQQTTICNCCDCACTLCTLGALAGASNRLRITGLFAILRSDATWRYLIHDDPTKVAPFHRPNDQEILTKIRCIGDVAINFTFGWHAYTVYQNKAWDLTMKLNNNFIVGMEEQAYLEGAMNRKVPSNRLKKRTPTIFFMR